MTSKNALTSVGLFAMHAGCVCSDMGFMVQSSACLFPLSHQLCILNLCVNDGYIHTAEGKSPSCYQHFALASSTLNSVADQTWHGSRHPGFSSTSFSKP
ncbi:hypothetical protein DL89DRAFT_267307 [Linderina pennispora]|uniref:Secreted protein n=1 Tax=Linderina pennispora TaxID=61395 RepID=A0A1Y1WA11_9FUNG|nr:uncharacterized protein DL89DRAFT_267307 [Linderina pennispora]ORX70076.1 hypothetical protein DL89DRAFT_267307 [Linderina pennispora]